MLLRIISRGFSGTKKQNFFWNDINANVLKAQYAVRGIVPSLANTMKDQIAKDPKSTIQVILEYPFSEITFCNIGNPQEFHQKPITFNREVLSCLLNPALIGNPSINPDAAKRAKRMLDEIISVGSYTLSIGIALVRQSVANYIAKTDGVPKPSINNIYITNGASEGVHLLLSTMITNPNDAIMIPIPQYPLYSATIALYGGSPAPYYLNEQNGWQLDIEELERSIIEARKNGKNVKCICVINPGNPTGAILSSQTIKKIIEFSVKNQLVIIADEVIIVIFQVYRENVYKKDAVFSSFMKILNTMDENTQQSCELASLHSVSKGLLGECGLRGGYLYLHNFNPAVSEQVLKLKSINLCSNTIGQAMVELMVNPPLQNVQNSTRTQYQEQYKDVYLSLKRRAEMVTEYLKSMKNVTCNEVEGAMYAFPQIKFSQKAIDAAEGKAPDLFYCLEVLKNTGIVLVPGSGFRQKPGTHHFRITTLILPQEKLQAKLNVLNNFNDSFHKKYE